MAAFSMETRGRRQHLVWILGFGCNPLGTLSVLGTWQSAVRALICKMILWNGDHYSLVFR